MKIGGLAGVTFLRWWMGTLDSQMVFYDLAVDPGSPLCRGQQIYIFWHEYILFPLAGRGHCNLAMLLSQHRDADILSRMAYHLGFEIVRGSTRRGGVAAIRQLLRKGRQLHLAITPDGPRGPRRRLAPGAVYLASRLGLPLVLAGIGYDRPWRLRQLGPFCRAAALFPGPGRRQPAGLRPARPRSPRHRALPREDRAVVEPLDAGGGVLGRFGPPHSRPEAFRAHRHAQRQAKLALHR